MLPDRIGIDSLFEICVKSLIPGPFSGAEGGKGEREKGRKGENGGIGERVIRHRAQSSGLRVERT